MSKIDDDLSVVSALDNKITALIIDNESAVNVLHAIRATLSEPQYDGLNEGQALLVLDVLNAVTTEFAENWSTSNGS